MEKEFWENNLDLQAKSRSWLGNTGSEVAERDFVIQFCHQIAETLTTTTCRLRAVYILDTSHSRPASGVF